MSAFIEIGRNLVNVDRIRLVQRNGTGCDVHIDDSSVPWQTPMSFVDLVMALEFVGCRTWLTSYGDGKKEPRPGEMAERQWRAGEDGLRPSESAREELQ